MARTNIPVPDTNVVKLKYMDTEPGRAAKGAKTLMQGWEYTASEPLLDGPVSRRVAVIDFDPDTGAVVPGAVFVPPKGRTQGRYDVKDELNSDAVDFMQVSVFSVVMKMMSIFEAPDVLGRKLRWAFDGEQLLVVPRAGKMPNAFYHRDSRSLQFFFVDDPNRPGGLVYTCLSPDIVAHETTHAILDGIAPDLYNATSPQALAMHEAIADLGAVMLAVRTDRLLRQVMLDTGGDIRNAEAFNEIARQFGEAIYGAQRPLRDLSNKASISAPGGLDLNEPHDLSNVLSAALYALLLAEYEQIRQKDFEEKLAKEEVKREADNLDALTKQEMDKLRFSVSGFALFKATEKFKRIAFRALDYLPPGEISFADYGRAMVAADVYSNPDDPEPREFIKAEFLRRGMVDDPSTLEPVDPDITLPTDLDLEQLAWSDWAAYRFAETWRGKLLIPAGIAFEVRPRLDVTRKTWRRQGEPVLTRTLLYKVAWQSSQQFQIGDFVNEVAVTRGTTLAIDWATRKVRTLLSTSSDHPSQSDRSTSHNNAMRDAFLAANIAEGAFEFSSPNVQIQNGMLRVRAIGQMLHMMEH
ncbi:peptidase M4 family protein (plasmid) [Rhizobium phaseoli]|uniref:hypothetical protein n=1 Tax=Rhizobium phaseoli TaxID=396 RepID=UPI0007E9377A|nr:hypothetical protein [Rhizobium phaseoli]ANL49733.1 peptidase M4 family protein [Rhizobium phaseoli]